MDTTLSQQDAHHAPPLTLAVSHAHTILQADNQPLILHYLPQALATKQKTSSFRVGPAWHAPCLTVRIVIILLPARIVLLGIPSINSSIVIFAMFSDVMSA